MNLPRPWSVQAWMVALTMAIVVPLLTFSAFLVIHAAEREQALMEREARERAQSTAIAIDHMLTAVRGRLFGLTSSAKLQDGDFEAYRQRVGALLKAQGMTMILSDQNGRAVFDTADLNGTAASDIPESAGLRRIASTGLPAVSGLVRGANGLPAALVSVPMRVRDQGTHVLSLNVITILQQVIVQQNLPENWIATVVDRDGYVLARNPDAARFVGRLGRPYAIAKVQAANEGSFSFSSFDGVPVENAFTHVSMSGWGVVIGIPRATLLAPVRHSTGGLALLGMGTLAVALLFAAVIGRRISGPIARLVELAETVGRGNLVGLTVTGLQEADAVAASLHEASNRLARTAAERERTAEDLRESGNRYRVLADRLADANRERQALLQLTVQRQEEERLRIARELHDGFGQYLTALRLGLTAMERGCRVDSEAPRQLASLKALTDELGQVLGRMAWEIRPTALDDLGLKMAIAQYLEEWAERSGLRIDQEVRIDGGRLPPEVETTLFRVVQEAVTNVVKHSGADHVAVILEADGREVRLIVEDNGRGFAANADGNRPPLSDAGTAGPPAGPLRGGCRLGLIGIRERLALVQGLLEVESSPGRGTTLYIRVPLAGAAS